MVSDKLRQRREQLRNQSQEKSYDRYVGMPVLATSETFDPYPNINNQIINYNQNFSKSTERKAYGASDRDAFGNITLMPQSVAVPTIGSVTVKNQAPYTNQSNLNDTTQSMNSATGFSSKFMSSQALRNGPFSGQTPNIISQGNLVETKDSIVTGISGMDIDIKKPLIGQGISNIQIKPDVDSMNSKDVSIERENS